MVMFYLWIAAWCVFNYVGTYVRWLWIPLMVSPADGRDTEVWRASCAFMRRLSTTAKTQRYNLRVYGDYTSNSLYRLWFTHPVVWARGDSRDDLAFVLAVILKRERERREERAVCAEVIKSRACILCFGVASRHASSSFHCDRVSSAFGALARRTSLGMFFLLKKYWSNCEKWETAVHLFLVLIQYIYI